MIRVQVTVEDIARGVRRDVYCCPIALAMKRQGFILASVSRGQVLASTADDVLIDAELPKKAKVFISRFDDGKPVEPFSFVLEA